MSRRLVLPLSVVSLILILALPCSPANAASAPCFASPPSGPVGTVFTITCSGFIPSEQTNAWLTEPDGATFSWARAFGGPLAAGKADGSGNVSYGFPTGSQNLKYVIGDWAMTVKGAGVVGIAHFTVAGVSEGVSGATLTNDNGTIVGTGFASFEIVTVWIDYPNGDCSANWYSGPGLSSAFYGDYKTDASGSFTFNFSTSPLWDCTGTYHIVARGNTSHLGGQTFWSTPNHPETVSRVARRLSGSRDFIGWFNLLQRERILAV